MEQVMAVISSLKPDVSAGKNTGSKGASSAKSFSDMVADAGGSAKPQKKDSAANDKEPCDQKDEKEKAETKDLSKSGSSEAAGSAVASSSQCPHPNNGKNAAKGSAATEMQLADGEKAAKGAVQTDKECQEQPQPSRSEAARPFLELVTTKTEPEAAGAKTLQAQQRTDGKSATALQLESGSDAAKTVPKLEVLDGGKPRATPGKEVTNNGESGHIPEVPAGQTKHQFKIDASPPVQESKHETQQGNREITPPQPTHKSAAPTNRAADIITGQAVPGQTVTHSAAGVENSQPVVEATVGDLVNRISEAIKENIVQKSELLNLGGRSEVHLQLKPEYLGKLVLQVALEKGKLDVKFLVEHGHVKQLIENNLVQLRHSLEDQNISWQQTSVDIGNFGGREFTGGHDFLGGHTQGMGIRPGEPEVLPNISAEAESAYPGSISYLV